MTAELIDGGRSQNGGELWEEVDGDWRAEGGLWDILILNILLWFVVTWLGSLEKVTGVYICDLFTFLYIYYGSFLLEKEFYILKNSTLEGHYITISFEHL